MHSVLDAIIASNEQLGKRAEQFAQLLVEHDKTLDELLERIGKTVPEIRAELDSRLTESVPGLVSDAYAKYNEDLEARCRAALAESQTKLEAVRSEIVALASQQFTEAEKQIGVTAEQIESRILGALTGAATERIEKLERGLVIEIQHAVNAALPKQEFAAAPGFIDSYRGQWREGMVAQRGDLFSWYGSTYLALEDTNDTPGRRNVGREGAKWAVIAARGAGGGGGGGGDSLPSQTGNAGKFLKTDGNATLWETIPGGGDMLGANNLTDVASVTAAFANIKQAATTTASGVVTFATSGESAALKAVQANDARLSDSRTPTAHASTHQTGGSDPIDFPVDSVFGATNTITQVDYLALNVSSTVAVTTAKIVWNATESTGELGFNGSVNTLLGMDVHAQVYNQSGSPFTKGQVVRVDGSSGTRLKASLALATNDANSSQTFGLCAQTIGNNESGVIITQGLLRAIDTNAYNTGDTLWLSATTPGAMVNVRPVAPYHGVRVGYVVKKAGSADGIIFVDVQNGLELEELHDVAITAVANNDIIAYNASTTVWRNRQLFDSTAPAALAVSATAGVSVTAARVDHVHVRPTFDELTIASATFGDILYRDSVSWARLPAGTSGNYLKTLGAGAAPTWATVSGGGGTSAQVDTYTTTGTVITWTKPSGAKMVEIICIGAGGGGGGGVGGNAGTARNGGGGAGGGARREIIVNADAMPATAYVIVGAAGAGGAGGSAGPGSSGTAGGNSSVAINNTNPPTVGIICFAGAGGGGGPGVSGVGTGGGSGGGTGGAGTTSTGNVNLAGGIPNPFAAVTIVSAVNGGAGGFGRQAENDGGNAEWGGGGAGGSRSSADFSARPGGDSLHGGGAGGGGKGISTGNVGQSDGSGGTSGFYGTGAAGGANGTTGGTGTAGDAYTVTGRSGGGGGGGGGGTAGNGGTGGAGGLGGGGGGGGGGGTTVGGTGGAGGAGIVIIATYF